jgi:uncharacterized membrane protein YkvA (DUF1232 family)
VPGGQLHGPLSSCYKIKLKKQGVRLVYEVEDDKLIVMVLAVDRREDGAAYKAAVDRLMRRTARNHCSRAGSTSLMWKRIALLWTLVRGDARQLWFALRHPAAPGWLKLGTAMIALYLLSPIDLIPDALPVIGVVDDLVLVPLAIRFLLNRLPADIARAAAARRAR